MRTYFYLVWMSVMHACMSVLLVHSVPEEARREHHIGEWNQMWILCKNRKSSLPLNHLSSLYIASHKYRNIRCYHMKKMFSFSCGVFFSPFLESQPRIQRHTFVSPVLSLSLSHFPHHHHNITKALLLLIMCSQARGLYHDTFLSLKDLNS